MKVEGKPMFDKKGKFVMGKFENVVSNAKELALEAMKVPELENEIKSLKRTLNNVKDVEIIKDTEVLPVRKPGMSIPRERGEVRNHRAEAGNFTGITKEGNKFGIVIHFISPETGKDTTMHRRRETLSEAVIARNEIAATLFVERLIDFERYLKIIRN